MLHSNSLREVVMRRSILKFGFAIVIATVGLGLASPRASAEPQMCDDWDLGCDGNICCTICKATGERGECFEIE